MRSTLNALCTHPCPGLSVGRGEGEGAAVEGNAHQELLLRGALLGPVCDAVLRIQGLVRPAVGRAGGDGGVVVSLAVPGSSQIVGHDVDEVEVLGQARHVVAFVYAEPGKTEDKQK